MILVSLLIACRAPQPFTVDNAQLISDMAASSAITLINFEPIIVYQEQDNAGLQETWSGPSSLNRWSKNGTEIIAKTGSIEEGSLFLPSLYQEQVVFRTGFNENKQLHKFSTEQTAVIATGDIRVSTISTSNICWTQDTPDHVYCDTGINFENADHPHVIGNNMVIHTLENKIMLIKAELSPVFVGPGDRAKLVFRNDSTTTIVAQNDGEIWVTDCENCVDDFILETLPNLKDGRTLSHPQPLFQNSTLLIIAEAHRNDVSNLVFGTRCEDDWAWLASDESVERELGGRRRAKASPPAIATETEIYLTFLERETQSAAMFTVFDWQTLIDDICSQ